MSGYREDNFRDDDPTYQYNNWRCSMSALRRRVRQVEKELSDSRAALQYHKEAIRRIRARLSWEGRIVARLTAILNERVRGTKKRCGEPPRPR